MPGRSNCHWPFSATLTIVDSMPIAQAPPSNTGMVSPNPDSTWAAVVGLSWVNKLAEGAATLRPLSFSSARVIVWLGTRSAMVGSLPRTMRDTWLFAGNTKVSAPGQKVSASLTATSGKHVAQLFTWLMSLICTING